ncbi:hypothetical protein M885DRAFT_561464 [Pelagophyceae sp. CCMP2097]|nr:hypothetical protein M885DRAFT_561464 [Pelagophyceae sp. CCMP2097]
MAPSRKKATLAHRWGKHYAALVRKHTKVGGKKARTEKADVHISDEEEEDDEDAILEGVADDGAFAEEDEEVDQKKKKHPTAPAEDLHQLEFEEAGLVTPKGVSESSAVLEARKAALSRRISQLQAGHPQQTQLELEECRLLLQDASDALEKLEKAPEDPKRLQHRERLQHRVQRAAGTARQQTARQHPATDARNRADKSKW